MKRIVPEFKMRSKVSSVLASSEQGEVEVWQLWCRTADGEDAHRATFREVRKAGFVRRNSGEGKAADKSAGRK